MVFIICVSRGGKWLSVADEVVPINRRRGLLRGRLNGLREDSSLVNLRPFPSLPFYEVLWSLSPPWTTACTRRRLGGIFINTIKWFIGQHTVQHYTWTGRVAINFNPILHFFIILGSNPRVKWALNEHLNENVEHSGIVDDCFCCSRTAETGLDGWRPCYCYIISKSLPRVPSN